MINNKDFVSELVDFISILSNKILVTFLDTITNIELINALCTQAFPSPHFDITKMSDVRDEALRFSFVHRSRKKCMWIAGNPMILLLIAFISV